MAIAFYVPEEYGPPPPENQQVGAVPIVDIHQHHHQQQQQQNVNQQDANNNVVVRGGNQEVVNDNPVNLMGLVSQFGREIMGVLQTVRSSANHREQSAEPSVSGANNTSGDNESRSRPPHRQPTQSSRRRSAQQDNHGSAPENTAPVVQVLDLLPIRSLPDIVTCHAGMSFRYGSSHPNPSQVGPEPNQNELLPPADGEGSGEESSLSSSPLHDSRQASGPEPLSPGPGSRHPPASMDFEVSLKLEMTMSSHNQLLDDVTRLPPAEEYRRAGRQLRLIADELEARSQRSRHGNQSTFELNVAISVAVPAVALVGLGLAYLRRNGLS